MMASAGITPEQFGAAGDGVSDDAPAIQRAFDAAARNPGGTVMLYPGTAYRCGSGLTLDASRVSLQGTALLDFSGWAGRYLRISASSTAGRGEAANNYGYKGSITGAIRLRGAGRDTRSIGISFDSDQIATAAQMLVENLCVWNCGTGVHFGNRAYNNLLVRCELFNCGVCVDWPTGEDNGERNTLIGCALYNSGLAARVSLASASLQLQGCSIDYTEQLYNVSGGSVQALSCHHESDRWQDRAIQCEGDGSFIRLDGGTILNQASSWRATHFVDAGRGSTTHLLGTFVHNVVLQSAPGYPSAWATGPGTFRMTDSQCFELSPLPARLQTTRTRLSDPDLRSLQWEDPVWRTSDTVMPITDRHGGPADNLRLSKGSVAGTRGLVAAKAGGSGSAASFVLIALPVSLDDMVLAGFRVRRDPRRPGGDATLFASPTWVRIDGCDQHRLPVPVRSEPVGTLTVAPTADAFTCVAPLASRTGRTAPDWATHFWMIVDLVKAHEASFCFTGLWADTI